MSHSNWPALPLNEWRETYQTLHLWTQVVGKIRLTLSPLVNHFWNAALYVSSRGLTTSAIPHGLDAFEIEFDFIDHRLEIRTSAGQRKSFALTAEPVASFYQRVMAALRDVNVTVEINTKPQELPYAPVPFERDFEHRSYDPEYARRFWRILLSSSVVMNEFRSHFIGKCSPVHFFWGSFDLACSRFSGRRAPPRKGVISGESYSHEEISAGWWPGGGKIDAPAYYAYSAPAPEGFQNARVQPGGWNRDLSEFILMYDEVRLSPSPERDLMNFLQSTYEAGATLGGWDRAALER